MAGPHDGRVLVSFLPTLSRLPLAQKCVYPWTGPERWPKRTTSNFAGFGTAVSEVAESLAVWGMSNWLPIADRNELNSTDRRRLQVVADNIAEQLEKDAAVWRWAELPLAWHAVNRRGRVLEQDSPRDFSDVRPGEMWGRPDLVWRGEDGHLVVDDYKTGRKARGVDPSDLLQLMACGVAAASNFGDTSVTVRLVLIGDDGAIKVKPHRLDRWEMAETAGDIAMIYEEIEAAGKVPVPRPGRHCDNLYCPKLAVCPATKRRLAELSLATASKFALVADIDDDEHALWQRGEIKRIYQALEVFDFAVKRYAERSPIPVGDGKVYGKREYESRSIEATPAAVKLLGDRGLHEAVETSTTKAAIEREVKKIAPKGKAAPMTREILKELDELGAIKRSTFAKYEEHRPRD